MQFSAIFLSAALAALTSAQNPFTFTTLSTVTAGTPFNITWAPSTGTVDTVTLVLRQGESSALTTVETIASSIQNTGSYLWTPSNTLVKGSQYAFQIVDDGNKDIVNYSGQFSIDSTNTVSSAVASSTSSASGSSTMTTSGMSRSSSSGTALTTLSGGSSSSTATRTTGTSSSGTPTGSATSTTTTAAAAVVHVGVGAGLLAVVGAGMALL